MSANTRRLLAWLPMVAVLAMIVRVALVWNRLPPIMMSHFDVHGTPDGYMPRTLFFVISVAITVPMVALFAVMADRIGSRKPRLGWGMLAFAWITDATLISVFWSAVTANLNHELMRVFPFWVLLIAMVPIVIILSIDWRWWLSRERKEAASKVASAQVITEQTHGSRLWGLFFAGLSVGLMALAFALLSHSQPAFVFPVLAAVGALIGFSAVWAWQGFAYRFTTQGIEIRALGFRLRSIPISEIEQFHSERCNPLTDFGGWGVKGFGTDTAYIWSGRKVLHIRTSHGDVYLGHNDPDRLVRDLEAIMNPAH